ncbi:MAG: hypothetical protein COV91_04365 [Candidatus Taylorbacteria bacterium CG11_big_fil_rev_8_21_14_0_20_46_11]|uniref:HTH deoR-type domain-containing protein n=1 Tax=Candidatus Taylorbacteria bacterium CG11_big_fil_rev_8_21_14_0_20_46_11 TaxID=1975025 RepID=A0A2H0KAW4_9BACT|nr:MAG: hypothetical protein COV91_04365 [Candidatus Taylorbacteria bacterium CG11_big_fil_rev_8_21_14_0_20_46_11]
MTEEDNKIQDASAETPEPVQPSPEEAPASPAPPAPAPLPADGETSLSPMDSEAIPPVSIPPEPLAPVSAPASALPEIIAPDSTDTEEEPTPPLTKGEAGHPPTDSEPSPPLANPEPFANSGTTPPLASNGAGIAPVRSKAEEPDNFPARFKAKLKELSLLGVEKRRRQADERIEKILGFAREHNRIDNEDARKLTGLSDERVRHYLDELEKEGKLEQFGRKRPKVFYMPIRDK